MNAVKDYLRLSPPYADFLGGLRWAAGEDALEYTDGRTFAFNEEVAVFVEGFGRDGGLIHFGFLLYLMDLLRNPDRTLTPDLARLRRAFADGGRSLRNAGAFFAVLCRTVPRVPEPVTAAHVCDILRNYQMPIRYFVSVYPETLPPAELPPLGPAAFHDLVLTALASCTDDDLREWLRHGRGSLKGTGEALARQLPPPRTLAGVLSDLLERPRLAGARAFVSQMVSALSLPRRRLVRPELPMGGYADVTTHGHVEQILPSQFALDELDFFRRLAENELLYFRREEPHSQARQELVVLLDQGVRTWGDVRLVLSAAALALGKQAARRRTPFRLATTSGGGELLDPLKTDADALGQLLEASDLTPDPGLALERVLEQPGTGPRDVVLLTHRRNLDEPDVLGAARRVADGVRLFAVALDPSGHVDLAEMRHGTPVRYGQFRVDLSQTPPPVADGPGTASDAWTGDVEPIGFPFRFGLHGPIGAGLFDFDHAGEWLLTASANGMLHAWRIDGQELMLLPRAMINRSVLANPDAVIGVRGGFVVTAQLTAAHYDLVRRTCRVHTLAEARGYAWNWLYSPEHHALVATSFPFRFGLDLDTGKSFTPESRAPSLRAREVWLAWEEGRLPTRKLGILNSLRPRPEHRRWASLYLDLDTGAITVRDVVPERPPFTPLADGQPALRGCKALAAECRGRTLAVCVSRPGPKAEQALHLFRWPEGTPLAVYLLAAAEPHFTLSRDGRWLARRVGNHRIHVHAVWDGAVHNFWTRMGGFPQNVQIRLGETWVVLHTGRRRFHLVRWDRGELQIEYHTSEPPAPDGQGIEAWPPGVADADIWHPFPDVIRYDRQRFHVVAANALTAVVDQFGQVVLLDAQERLLGMLFAFRDRLAAWMPDGTYLGPPSLTGRPPTPNAAVKIGRMLWQATERGRSRS